jgi:hypothetical protein
MHKILATFAASAAFVCLSSLAQAATVSLTEVSGGPSSGEVSINLASATNSLTSTGLAGTTTISFSSTQLLDFANGNATISIHGAGTFSNLTVSVPTGFTFTDLDFSALFPTGNTGNVTVTAENGATQVGAATATNVGPGLQELLFASNGPLAFTSVVIISGDTQFSQLKNFAISGLSGPNTVPLPGTFALLGTVLAGAAAVGKLRKRKVAALAPA